VVAGITAYFEPGRTVDDLFRDCLHLIIDPPAATGETRDDVREASAGDG
jgi:hypothetical protein